MSFCMHTADITCSYCRRYSENLSVATDSIILNKPIRIDMFEDLKKQNAELKAALLEVTSNYAIQGKKLELAKECLEYYGNRMDSGKTARECLEKLQ